MHNGNFQRTGGSSSKSKTSSSGNYLSCSSTSSIFSTTNSSNQNRRINIIVQDSSPESLTNINSNNYRFGSRVLINPSPQLENYDSSMTDVVIDDLQENEPTSAILNFCKKRFLRPYVALLSLVGLHPNATDISSFWLWCSNFYTLFIFLILLSGYVLQYFSNFRRDRGFTPNQIHLATSGGVPAFANSPYKATFYNFGEIFFAYIIPSIIHLFGFFSAIYVFRIVDNEQLQNLVERVFLMSNHPKKLCIRLWLYVLGGLIWLLFLLTYLILSVLHHPESMKLPKYASGNTDLQRFGKTVLILTIFTHDLVQMVILTSFCIECYLLQLHLSNLKEKLLQHTIESIDWMREVLEFRKLLNHLNQRVATPVCFFTVLNLSYAFAGIIYLFKEYDFDSPIKIFSLNIASIFIWLIIGLLPFFQAASVTRICKLAQASGHQIRVRPFVYENSTDEDLNSTLLFASSLNMSAKLFKMPIQANYLCFAILIISVVILTLGMCLNVSLGIL